MDIVQQLMTNIGVKQDPEYKYFMGYSAPAYAQKAVEVFRGEWQAQWLSKVYPTDLCRKLCEPEYYIFNDYPSEEYGFLIEGRICYVKVQGDYAYRVTYEGKKEECFSVRDNVTYHKINSEDAELLKGDWPKYFIDENEDSVLLMYISSLNYMQTETIKGHREHRSPGWVGLNELRYCADNYTQISRKALEAATQRMLTGKVLYNKWADLFRDKCKGLNKEIIEAAKNI